MTPIIDVNNRPGKTKTVNYENLCRHNANVSVEMLDEHLNKPAVKIYICIILHLEYLLTYILFNKYARVLRMKLRMA